MDTPTRNLVGGHLVEAVSGEVLDVLEPATGAPLAAVPAGRAADVERAVDAAGAAFP
jgi:acyl-CoA reductase-like NAD-dependent aldehyde dehydrogenase